MADFINTVDRIGDDALVASIIQRTITEYKDDSILTVGKYALYDCKQLTSVDFPAATSIGNYAFYECKQLTSVDFPVATSIGDSAFSYCSQLTSVDFPVATSIDGAAFQGCTTLTSVNLPAATIIGYFAFADCSQLTALILRNNAVCTLGDATAFYSTPIIKGTGYIYVPAALYDSYAGGTNWSTYSAQLRKLEDYTVDGTTTGELDPTKI